VVEEKGGEALVTAASLPSLLTCSAFVDVGLPLYRSLTVFNARLARLLNLSAAPTANNNNTAAATSPPLWTMLPPASRHVALGRLPPGASASAGAGTDIAIRLAPLFDLALTAWIHHVHTNMSTVVERILSADTVGGA